MIPAPLPDPARCPLCGEANACAMQAAGAAISPSPSCWCLALPAPDFPATLLERVPPASRGRACICTRCAAAASSLSAIPKDTVPCP